MRGQTLLTVRRVGVVVLLGAMAVVLYRVDPAATGWLPKCPLHVVTGWHCPGCGSTRAVHALLHADLAQALSFNALLVCSVPVGLAVWLRQCAARRRTLSEWSTMLAPRWIWTIVAVGLAFAIVRNLPYYPFHLLAPH